MLCVDDVQQTDHRDSSVVDDNRDVSDVVEVSDDGRTAADNIMYVDSLIDQMTLLVLVIVCLWDQCFFSQLF